jgi:hypothetical protein
MNIRFPRKSARESGNARFSQKELALAVSAHRGTGVPWGRLVNKWGTEKAAVLYCAAREEIQRQRQARGEWRRRVR